MGYYSFGQETVTPEEYLRKTGEDYAQNRDLEEPEPEYEVDYNVTAKREPSKPAAPGSPASAAPAVVSSTLPKPVQAGLSGSAMLVGVGLLGLIWWMRR
jgi:hypothetical protein